MIRTKWAVVVTAVIALGAAGCGSGTGAGAKSGPVSPRPEGTGPLAREVVQTDIDTSAAAAGAPATDPDWRKVGEESASGLCVVSFRGFFTEAIPADLARFDDTVRELGRRDWKDAGKKTQKKDKKGKVYESRVLLEQRGWRIVAEYQEIHGTLGLTAFDTACAQEQGLG
ncbi:hypothetical protein OHA37_15860 [Streptomyces sp. NBC_00335]|uniref:hypothetical protein n=1 Tax=unclassified Streptomyces TaxID=2593676 RepID=UPI002255D847|nr:MULTISPECIES: hypothetical protein [unclassified Streptomyces]MCX5405358.1 hypothetical protein [Streptomyces sp. NBC_00086]